MSLFIVATTTTLRRSGLFTRGHAFGGGRKCGSSVLTLDKDAQVHVRNRTARP